MLYLRFWFWIDLVSILPFDMFSLLDPASPLVKSLKSVRIIRLLRLLKLVRIVKASRMMEQWQNHMSISFAKLNLIKLSLTLTCVAHWMACIWGLIGKLYGTQLECGGDGFKEVIWKADVSESEGHSWVTHWAR